MAVFFNEVKWRIRGVSETLENKNVELFYNRKGPSED